MTAINSPDPIQNLIPEGSVLYTHPVSTVDENAIIPIIEAYESFSTNDARVDDFDFYGERKVRIFQKDRIEVECGYLQPSNVPDGAFTVSAPSRDTAGRHYTMKITFPKTTDWRVRLEGGSYREGWIFTYVGKISPEGTGYMELIPQFGEGETIRLPINL